MKIKLRLITFLTAGITTAAFLGVHLSAADLELYISEEDSRYKYTYVDESAKTISVLANQELSGNIKIPSELDGNTVVEISDYGFTEQNDLTGITLPDTVTKLGSFAFNNCPKLEKASIPDSINNMGVRPFMLTPFEEELESKSDSDFVLLNGDILYKYTGSEPDIVIPDGVRVISSSVFAYDKSNEKHIIRVSFPDSVQYICEMAFWDCTDISSIILGSGIKNIAGDAFTGSNITITGYLETYAQEYAKNANYEFEPILNEGETRTEIHYSKGFRQYYFSDEESFSRDGIKVYTRNYNGTLTEITDWNFTATPKSLYKD